MSRTNLWLLVIGSALVVIFAELVSTPIASGPDAPVAVAPQRGASGPAWDWPEFTKGACGEGVAILGRYQPVGRREGIAILDTCRGIIYESDDDGVTFEVFDIRTGSKAVALLMPRPDLSDHDWSVASVSPYRH